MSLYEEELPEFTVGDMARDLTGILTSNDVPVDLTGATHIEAHIQRTDMTVLTHIISNGGFDGTWVSPWEDGDLNQRGIWQVEIEVTWQGEKPQTFPPALFKVRDQFA